MNAVRISDTRINSTTNVIAPLKVLMISARYSPFVGGTETHVHEVGKRIKQAGHDITVLTTDPTNTLPLSEIRDGLPVKRIRAYPANRDYYFAPALYRSISEGHWDLIHLQGYHTLVAPVTMLAALACSTPYVVSFHSGGHSSSMRTSIRGMQRTLLTPLLRRAARLICVSQYEAEFFGEKLGLAKQKFVVIPNGSQLPKLSSPPATTGETVIVSLGRLERYKGHHRAIEALPFVLQHNPDVKLRIVGTGPYESQLRELVQKLELESNVEIGGIPAEDRDGMAKLLSQASLVVLFSDYEAHPVAVMEALSLGCSVLVTDTSGLGELARKGWVNAVPLESDPQYLAKAMINQLDNPVNPGDVELPTWEQCANALVDTYHDAILSYRALK